MIICLHGVSNAMRNRKESARGHFGTLGGVLMSLAKPRLSHSVSKLAQKIPGTAQGY